MSRRLLVPAFVCSAIVVALDSHLGGAALPQASPTTAEAVARQVQDRNTGRDSRAAMRMKLFDRHDRVRERALAIITLRGRNAPGAPPSAPDGDRLLIRFNYPNDIRGTGFLVWEHPDADDERFLYLPSLGRVRRIAGSEAQESFVGSDFTYEDIGGRELEDYTYALFGEETWTAPDGSRHAVWRLESKSRKPGARFPRVVSLIRKDLYIAVRAEIYNRRNEKQKTFDARRIEKTDGYWTVTAMTMADALEGTRTELVVEKAEYDVGLKADDFSRVQLERGVR